MVTTLLGLCARPYCKGAIMEDGTCHLCGRSVEAPQPAMPLISKKPPRPRVTYEGVDLSRLSVKCRARNHGDCGGQRLADGYYGMALVPCECSCHEKEGATCQGSIS